MEEAGKQAAVEMGPGSGSPERGPESEPDRESEPQSESASVDREPSAEPSGEPSLPSISSVSVPRSVQTRDPLLIEVERRLEDNLWDVYAALPRQERLRFKQEGERVARTIRDGLAAGKMAAHGILTLIVRWLKLIPGVNGWFLTQEAKIKTDALIRLERERNENGTGV